MTELAELNSPITLENYAMRMSSFDSNSAGASLYALVDMGSNGIRFSISDLAPPETRLLRCVYQYRAAISLYDALHAADQSSEPFHFSQATITATAQEISNFKAICDHLNVPTCNIQVFATEAMRTAKNRDDMIFAIKEMSGLAVNILSPAMESLFGAMGARSAFHQVDGLFLDLGGGSVQMTYIDSSQTHDYHVLAAQAAISLPFGAARVSGEMKSQGSNDSIILDLQQSMRGAFEGLKNRFPRLNELSGQGVALYLCGGGFRGYGSMLMHTDPIQPYPVPTIGGYRVSGHRFTQWQEMLQANEFDGKIQGLSKRRRVQFPAIVAVIQALIQAIPNISEVTFCSGGNREGVLYMKLPATDRESDPRHCYPSDALNTSNISAVLRKLGEALPENHPSLFSRGILEVLVRETWNGIGDSTVQNSTRALHQTISGSLAGLPGLDHSLRAAVALTLCYRWGKDIGKIDLTLYDQLRQLLGPELSWWCAYVGETLQLLASISPVAPQNARAFDRITFAPVLSHDSCNAGHKLRLRLRVNVDRVFASTLDKAYKNISDGLNLDWKVKVDVIMTGISGASG